MWARDNSTIKKDMKKVRETENKKARGFVWYGVNYCQEPPEYTEAWLTTKRILNRLNNDVLSIGSELFVFTVPGLYEVVPEKINELSKRKVPNPELICMEEVPAYDRLADILTELDIEYVDLLPSFRKNRGNNGLNLFRESDEHWNEQGHSLAAKIVYSALTKEGLFPFGGKKDPVQ